MAINTTIKLKDEPRIIEAFKSLYPVPTDQDAQGNRTPRFSDDEWVRECLRLFVIQQVARYEQMKAQQAIRFQPDMTLAE